jgi:hypothetical protein
LPDISTFSNDPLITGLEIKEINKLAWLKKIGYGIIKNIEIEIGGDIIETHNSDWLNIQSNIFTNGNKEKGLDKMIGNIKELYDFTNGKKSYRLYIPLQFWFCKNYKLALPIMALNNSDIKINVEFNDINDCLILGPQ